MGRSLRYNKNTHYKCLHCEYSNSDEYEVGRHSREAHPGQPHDNKKLTAFSVIGKKPVAQKGIRKRTLARESAEAPEDANEEDYDYDDEDYDGDGPPPKKLRRLLPYQTLDSPTLPTPDTPAASQGLLVNESSEPQYDPRLILSKEANNDPNFMPELHSEIKKAIVRTKEHTEQTTAATIEGLNKEIAGLKADVKARDDIIEFMRKTLRKLE